MCRYIICMFLQIRFYGNWWLLYRHAVKRWSEILWIWLYGTWKLCKSMWIWCYNNKRLHSIYCARCVSACPKNIIELVPVTQKVHVACSSTDKGALTKNYCTSGCIGCKICEKKCEFDAIKVENNVAHIDYTKCTSCGLCAEACPKKIIHIA